MVYRNPVNLPGVTFAISRMVCDLDFHSHYVPFSSGGGGGIFSDNDNIELDQSNDSSLEDDVVISNDENSASVESVEEDDQEVDDADAPPTPLCGSKFFMAKLIILLLILRALMCALPPLPRELELPSARFLCKDYNASSIVSEIKLGLGKTYTCGYPSVVAVDLTRG